LITKITGQLIALHEDVLTLRIDAFEYEVLIPEFTRRQLQTELGQEISLHTIEYLEGNPMQGRMTPRLIGFINEVEREFFELFCSVDGVGVRKALRAMVRPVKDVATAIEEQDAKALSGLPGIGPAMAERVIAKLRRKVPKFALLVTQEEAAKAAVEPDAALSAKKKYKDVESLIQAVYQQSQR
jgi:Holliday junction DNA helicase RuvA